MQQQIEALLHCIIGIARGDTSCVISSFKNLLDQQFQTAKDYNPKIEWFEGTWSRYKPQKGKDIRGVSGFDTKELIKLLGKR